MQLVTFTANPNETILSVSYQLEKMFNTYHGTETLPVTNTAGDINPLFWAASIEGESNSIYLKVINSGNTTQSLSVDIDATYSNVNGSIMVCFNPQERSLSQNVFQQLRLSRPTRISMDTISLIIRQQSSLWPFRDLRSAAVVTEAVWTGTSRPTLSRSLSSRHKAAKQGQKPCEQSLYSKLDNHI